MICYKLLLEGNVKLVSNISNGKSAMLVGCGFKQESKTKNGKFCLVMKMKSKIGSSICQTICYNIKIMELLSGRILTGCPELC